MIKITAPQARNTVDSFYMLEKIGLDADGALAVGKVWREIETEMQAMADPKDNTEELKIKVDLIPWSSIRKALRGARVKPSIFKEELVLFIDENS